MSNNWTSNNRPWSLFNSDEEERGFDDVLRLARVLPLSDWLHATPLSDHPDYVSGWQAARKQLGCSDEHCEYVAYNCPLHHPKRKWWAWWKRGGKRS